MVPEAPSAYEVARSFVSGEAVSKSSGGGMMYEGVARLRLLLLLQGWIGGEHGF